jgi:hypothetical protein
MQRRLAAFGLSVLTMIAVAAAWGPARETDPPATPAFACETIDWRVASKLTRLRDRTDSRTQAIVSHAMLQREQARLHCRVGRIDDAMGIYRVLDRALTRYVQYGTSPELPNALEDAP